jgi:hypothetical protein
MLPILVQHLPRDREMGLRQPRIVRPGNPPWPGLVPLPVRTIILVAASVAVCSASPAHAHLEAPLYAGKARVDDVVYSRGAQKLAVDGHVAVGNRASPPQNVACRLVLHLRMSAEERRIPKRVTFRVWAHDRRYEPWRAMIINWGQRWHVARHRAVELHHCHVKAR